MPEGQDDNTSLPTRALDAEPRSIRPGVEYIRLLWQTDQLVADQREYTLDFANHPELALIQAEPQLSADEIKQRLDELRKFVETIEENMPQERRVPFLESIDGLQVRLRQLNGETVPLSEVAEKAYGIKPEYLETPWLDAWHQELRDLVPQQYSEDSDTPTAEALQKFAEAHRLPDLVESPEKAESISREIVTQVLTRAKTLGIPATEIDDLDIEVAIDPPGGDTAYFKYEDGRRKLRISLYTKTPPTVSGLISAITHELGHAIEIPTKDELVEKGWDEWAAFGLQSPRAMLSEGFAQLFEEYVFPTAQSLHDMAMKIYEQAHGQPATEEEREETIRLIETRYLNQRYPVWNPTINAIMDYETKGREAAIERFQKDALTTEADAKRRVSFMDMYGAYAYVYPESQLLYTEWVNTNPDNLTGEKLEALRLQRLIRLIKEPLVPVLLPQTK